VKQFATRISAFLFYGLLALTVGLATLFVPVAIYFGASELLVPDTRPPLIRSLSVSDITLTGAVISWKTDEPATSELVLTSRDGLPIRIESGQVRLLDHSITISGLKPDTIYDITVAGKDASGNEAVSRGQLTTPPVPDVEPPLIAGVYIAKTTETSAAVTWVTDEPSTSQVEYGTTEAYGQTTPLSEELTASHVVVLQDLKPDTLYYFTVKSKDARGNESASESDRPFETTSTVPVGTSIGNRAPDFTLQTLEGKAVSLSDYRGTKVMLNFWVGQCPACVAEMPYIQAAYENSLSKEFIILAVNIRESQEAVQSFMETNKLDFPVLLDLDGKVDNVYKPAFFPTTFFLDARGIIKEIKTARFNSPEEIENIIKAF